MGNVIGIRQMGQSNQKFSWLSGTVPTISRTATNCAEQSANESSVGMDDKELEADCNRDCGVDFIDFRKFVNAFEHSTQGRRNKAIRRFGIATLTIWCAASTVMNIMTLQTIQSLNGIITDMQHAAQTAEVQTNEAK